MTLFQNKYRPLVYMAIFALVLVIGFVSKNSINHFISEKLRQQNNFAKTNDVKKWINENYNYTLNDKDFECTLLEFGTGNCVQCKQMEPVLEALKNDKKLGINVVFLHTMNPENQSVIKYYGVSAIPMQVLLDKNGVEFFRHYGFISEEELKLKFANKKN